MSARPSQPALVDTALRAQENARARSQFNSDSILISKSSDTFQSACGVQLLNHDQMRRDLTKKLAAHSSGVGRQEREGARLAIQVFTSQSSSRLTEFNINGVSHTQLLPGGIPIIDHLAAYVTSNPGFSGLQETIEHIRNNRVPSVEQLKTIKIKELVLGIASARQLREATEWVKERILETRERFGGLTICAADVEDIAIPITGRVHDTTSLMGAIHEETNSLWLRQLPNPPGTRTVSCPVLFMFGSIDWQLHLRIHVSYHKDDKRTDVALHKGEIPAEEYGELMSAIGPAVGTGVTSDYASFFGIVAALYNEDRMPCGAPVELDRLARLAGADHPQTGLVSQVWTWLGGVLPKHFACSTGDGKWGRDFQELPVGLKLYLLGDIQQVVKVAMTMLMVQAIHLFPDPTFPYRTTGMSGADFVRYWAGRITYLLTREPGNWAPLPRSEVRHHKRDALIDSAGIPPGRDYDILRLCPGWPAITNGGPRDMAVVGDWYVRQYHYLRTHDTRVFPAHNPQELKAFVSQSVQVRAALPPSVTGAMAVLPIEDGSRWVDLPPERLTFENIRAEKSRSGDATNRSVMGKYIRYDRERALRLLELWEADPTWPDRLFAKNRGYPFVRDLREFLRAQNMLPVRPPGWTDPLGEEQYGVAKLINLEKHNAIVLQQQMNAINRRMEKLEGRKRASRTLSEPGDLRDHANHPLVRSAGPRDHITTPGGQQTGRSRKHKRSVQSRYEALVNAGLLQIKPEDLRERSIKEIVSDRLASGHKLTAVQGVATRNTSPQPGPSHGQDEVGTINRKVRELSPKREESPPPTSQTERRVIIASPTQPKRETTPVEVFIVTPDRSPVSGPTATSRPARPATPPDDKSKAPTLRLSRIDDSARDRRDVKRSRSRSRRPASRSRGRSPRRRSRSAERRLPVLRLSRVDHTRGRDTTQATTSRPYRNAPPSRERSQRQRSRSPRKRSKSPAKFTPRDRSPRKRSKSPARLPVREKSPRRRSKSPAKLVPKVRSPRKRSKSPVKMPAAKKSPLKPSPVKPPFAAAKAIANARATAAAKAAAAKSAAAAKVAEMAKALAPAPSTTTTVVKTKTVPTTSTKSTKLVSDPPAKPSPSTPLKSEGTATLKEGRANALPNPMPQWKDGKAPSEQPTQKEAVANYKIPKNVKGKGWDRSRQPDIGKNKRDLLDSDSDSDESNLHSQSLPEKPSVKKEETTAKPTVLPATRIPLPDEELLDYEPGEEELIIETDPADEDIETIMDSLCQVAGPPQKSSMKKPEDAAKSPGATRGRKKITFDPDPKPTTAATRRKLDTSGDRDQDKAKEPPMKRQRNAPNQDKEPQLDLDNLSAEEYKRLEQFFLARQSKDGKPSASKKK